jgi:NADP-dependent 3-hydroxy acid dehydrogenase YdfG
MSKVCLVTGVGEGNGAAITRSFAADGYRVAMLARSEETLRRFEAEIEGATGYVCDVTDSAQCETALGAVRKELGPVDVFVHNAGSGSMRKFMDTRAEDMEAAWRTNTLALLLLGKPIAAEMLAAGRGAIVVIGATSALRGGANFAPFAAAKAAQRSLAQSMARSLGPEGVHVSYLVIDGVIDTPRTRRTDWGRDMPDDFFLCPADVAQAVHTLAHQPKSAWTFEMDIRPFGEKW